MIHLLPKAWTLLPVKVLLLSSSSILSQLRRNNCRTITHTAFHIGTLYLWFECHQYHSLHYIVAITIYSFKQMCQSFKYMSETHVSAHKSLAFHHVHLTTVRTFHGRDRSKDIHLKSPERDKFRSVIQPFLKF